MAATSKCSTVTKCFSRDVHRLLGPGACDSVAYWKRVGHRRQRRHEAQVEREMLLDPESEEDLRRSPVTGWDVV